MATATFESLFGQVRTQSLGVVALSDTSLECIMPRATATKLGLRSLYQNFSGNFLDWFGLVKCRESTDSDVA
jgi:hypothetical protein